MSSIINTTFKKLVKQFYEDVMNDKCELEEEQMIEIMSVIGHKSLSKEQACNEVLHWSRSKFDQLVGQGLMPKGRKVRGFTELRWYEDELLEYKRKLK